MASPQDWMNTELHKQDQCNQVMELQARLEVIRQRIIADMLHAMSACVNTRKLTNKLIGAA